MVRFLWTNLWSEAIAVDNLNFIAKVKSELGFKAAHREVIEGIEGGGTHALREQSEAYGSNFTDESEALRPETLDFGTKIPNLRRLSLVLPQPGCAN
jgi:hypothetical protein